LVEKPVPKGEILFGFGYIAYVCLHSIPTDFHIVYLFLAMSLFLRVLPFFCVTFFLLPVAFAQDIASYEKAVTKRDMERASEQALELAEYYIKQRNGRDAKDYYYKATLHAQQIRGIKKQAAMLKHIGASAGRYAAMNSEALEALRVSAEKYKSSGDFVGAADANYLGGRIQSNAGNQKYAIRLLSSAKKEYFNYKQIDKLQKTYEALADAYEKMGNTAKAEEYRRLASESRNTRYASVNSRRSEYQRKMEMTNNIDSLNLYRAQYDSINAIAAKANEELDAKLKTLQEKEAEIEQHKEENEKLTDKLTAEELANQRLTLIIAISIGAAIVVLILAIFAVLQRNTAVRARKQLAEQNQEILAQKEEIDSQKQLVEKEKDKAENLLLNILPRATADELKEKGEATPRHYNQVSVIFTDFKGFTHIAEKMTPEELLQELNKCFYRFDEICDEYGVEKIKTIGDAYMCAAGIPTANDTIPIDAVKAGLAMQEFMHQWKEEKIAQGEPYFELRLGIHTGPLVAGVVGKNKFAYDIWGDAVNLAARMESSGEVGKVNISGGTYELVKEHFDCTYRGKIEAKNKGEVDMYFVNGAHWYM